MTATTALRLAIVDDSQVVRMGLKALLSTEPGITIVGEASKVAEAVSMAANTRPDVVLLDIRLPDGTGFDACRRITENNPATRILFLTSVIDDQLINDAIRCGGHGYLLKEVGADDLVQAIFNVAAGKSVLDPQATARVLQLMRNRGGMADDPVSSLSPQERRVLALIAAGKTNKEVGNELGLTEKTVKNYLANVFGKLNVTRRSQAVALFVSAGNTAT
ncbi:MAG: response regulator transcription factor [Opitutaceae bacterium]